MPKIRTRSKRHQPKGFEILHEDRDLIVGNKAAGALTVRALWNKHDNIHAALNRYVRKGNSKSHSRVFVVHRLDQETSGVLVFAKSEEAQTVLKDNWKDTVKTYYAVVHGRLPKKSGTITSYLSEDEEYVVRSTSDSRKGKLATTAYTVVKEAGRYSLVKVNLLTGRKNQIRVHLAELGHPVVGDSKYGRPSTRDRRLALHSQSISLIHPFSGERRIFEAPLPGFFETLLSEKDFHPSRKAKP